MKVELTTVINDRKMIPTHHWPVKVGNFLRSLTLKDTSVDEDAVIASRPP